MDKERSVFDSNNLLLYIFRNRKVLMIVVVVAAVLSAIFSAPIFIKPRYKSTAVVFAATTYSPSQALLVEHNPYRKDVLSFGEEEHAEQLLQILNSDEIREGVVEKYKLDEHYKLSKEDPLYESYMIHEFSQRVSFRKTEYLAIEIKVMDESPQMASDIANYIVDLIDVVFVRIRSERAEQALHILDKEFNKLNRDLQAKDDSIHSLMAKGMIHYDAQVERLTEYYAKAIAENNTRGAKALKKELALMSKYSSQLLRLQESSELMQEHQDVIRSHRDNLLIDTQERLTNKFVVNKAYPAVKKSYPIRWLIVVASVFVSFVLAILILVTIDSVKKTANQS